MIELEKVSPEEIQKYFDIAIYNVWNDPELNDLQPEMSIAGVECDDSAVAILANQYVYHFRDVFHPNGIGLYIFGEIGSGKTYQAKLISKLLNFKTDEFQSCFYLCETATKLFDENTSFRTLVERADLLILDGFSIPRTAYQIQKLRALIDARYESRKPLIITTTIDRSEILKKVSDPDLKDIYDKLIEMCHPIFIDHSPRRKELARERKEAINKLLRI